VHTAITGSTFVDKVASIKFDVGLPQALMKKVIAKNTAEGAPSPLNTTDPKFREAWHWMSAATFQRPAGNRGNAATTERGALERGRRVA
jgi:aminoglycoside/choline kinase family phosphotransferase